MTNRQNQYIVERRPYFTATSTSIMGENNDGLYWIRRNLWPFSHVAGQASPLQLRFGEHILVSGDTLI